MDFLPDSYSSRAWLDVKPPMASHIWQYDKMDKQDNVGTVLAANLIALMDWHPDLRTQTPVARKSGLGQSTIGRIRRNDVSALSKNVEALADAFGLTTDQLLFPRLAEILRDPKTCPQNTPQLIGRLNAAMHATHGATSARDEKVNLTSDQRELLDAYERMQALKNRPLKKLLEEQLQDWKEDVNNAIFEENTKQRAVLGRLKKVPTTAKSNKKPKRPTEVDISKWDEK